MMMKALAVILVVQSAVSGTNLRALTRRLQQGFPSSFPSPPIPTLSAEPSSSPFPSMLPSSSPSLSVFPSLLPSAAGCAADLVYLNATVDIDLAGNISEITENETIVLEDAFQSSYNGYSQGCDPLFRNVTGVEGEIVVDSRRLTKEIHVNVTSESCSFIENMAVLTNSWEWVNYKNTTILSINDTHTVFEGYNCTNVTTVVPYVSRAVRFLFQVTYSCRGCPSDTTLFDDGIERMLRDRLVHRRRTQSIGSADECTCPPDTEVFRGQSAEEFTVVFNQSVADLAEEGELQNVDFVQSTVVEVDSTPEPSTQPPQAAPTLLPTPFPVFPPSPACPMNLGFEDGYVEIFGNKFSNETTYINLVSSVLTGTIPCELFLLTQLTMLYMDQGSLTGAIPTEFALLTALQIIDLSHNSFIGPIPIELTTLVNLKSLDLTSNNLVGTLPSELGLLTELTFLDVRLNSLVGPIPAEIGGLTKLRYARFCTSNTETNTFTGVLPTELGTLTDMISGGLQLSCTSFEMTIPSEIISLDTAFAFNVPVFGTNYSIHSTYINVVSSVLTGTIPTEVWLLTKLTGFYMDQGSLTGEIPTELAILTALKTINLSYNSFTGLVPDELASLAELSSLDVRGNLLDEPVPPSLELVTLFQPQDWT